MITLSSKVGARWSAPAGCDTIDMTCTIAWVNATVHNYRQHPLVRSREDRPNARLAGMQWIKLNVAHVAVRASCLVPGIKTITRTLGQLLGR